MLDLNYHESAALIGAHEKRCELHTEAESAHAETVAQRTHFAEMRRISSHNGWCNTELTQGFDGEIGKGIGGTFRSVVPTSKGNIQYDIHTP